MSWFFYYIHETSHNREEDVYSKIQMAEKKYKNNEQIYNKKQQNFSKNETPKYIRKISEKRATNYRLRYRGTNPVGQSYKL